MALSVQLIFLKMLRLSWDRKSRTANNAVVGANETGYHSDWCANPGRDSYCRRSRYPWSSWKAKSHQMGKVLNFGMESKSVTFSNSAHATPLAWGADVLDENGRAVPTNHRDATESVSPSSSVMEQHARLFVNKTPKGEYSLRLGN